MRRGHDKNFERVFHQEEKGISKKMSTFNLLTHKSISE